MAAALVQQQGEASGSPGTNVAITLTFGATLQAGDVVVVCAEHNDTGAAGPTCTGTGIVFTRHTAFIGDANHDNSAMWVGMVGSGAGTTVVITPSSGQSLGTHAISAVELSGVAQVVDGTPPAPTNLSSASPSVTSPTPVAVGDVAVAFCGHPDATGPTSTPSGWTALTRRSSTASLEGAWFDLGSSQAAVTPQWFFAASKFALMNVVLLKTTQPTTPPTTPIMWLLKRFSQQPGSPWLGFPQPQVFTTGPQIQTFDIAVDGNAAVAVDVTRTRALDAPVAGAGVVTAAESTQISLVVPVVGAGVVVVALTKVIPFAAAVDGNATVVVDIVRIRNLNVPVAGAGVVTADMVRTMGLAAAVAGAGVVTVDEVVQRSLAAAVAGAGVVAADMVRVRNLLATVDGNAAVAVAMTVSSLKVLSVNVDGTAVVSLGLSPLTGMAVNVQGQAFVSPQVVVKKIFATTVAGAAQILADVSSGHIVLALIPAGADDLLTLIPGGTDDTLLLTPAGADDLVPLISTGGRYGTGTGTYGYGGGFYGYSIGGTAEDTLVLTPAGADDTLTLTVGGKDTG